MTKEYQGLSNLPCFRSCGTDSKPFTLSRVLKEPLAGYVLDVSSKKSSEGERLTDSLVRSASDLSVVHRSSSRQNRPRLHFGFLDYDKSMPSAVRFSQQKE